MTRIVRGAGTTFAFIEPIFWIDDTEPHNGRATMARDALEAARARYTVAYEAYQQAAQRVARRLGNGRAPSAQEVEDEGKAIEQLAAARRELLDVITRLAPQRR
jgi:hypothetical protein